MIEMAHGGDAISSDRREVVARVADRRRKIGQDPHRDPKASARPLLTWALVIFLAGVLVGLVMSRAMAASVVDVPAAARDLEARPAPVVDGRLEHELALLVADVESQPAERPQDRGAGVLDDMQAPGPSVEPAHQVASRSPQTPEARAAIAATIRNAFRERGLDADRAVAIATCESQLRPDAVGDGGSAVGLWQFHLATWLSNSRRLFGRDVGDQRADPVVSSMVAAAKIARDGDWSAWSCAR